MKNSSTFGLVASIVIGLSLQLPARADSIDAQYRSERAVCLSGQSNQDRATCLKEASAARAEARRHGLDTSSAPVAQNATARCTALPSGDRGDCERRMRGEGTVSGSVREGGLLRELTTEMPAK